jgi:AbrB family looped-hinge helix DNA binding protein
MATSKMSAKGQILIPEQLRRNLGLKAGGKVQLIEEGSRLVVTPAAEDPIATATGFLTGKFSLIDDLRSEHRNGLVHEIGRKFSPKKHSRKPAQ